MMSLKVEFKTEDDKKENKQSPNVVCLCSGHLRNGMV